MVLDRAMKPHSPHITGDVDEATFGLRDEADVFEDALAAEMLRTGAIRSGYDSDTQISRAGLA